MRELYVKGVATRNDPESCGHHREVMTEALTGASMGAAIEPRKKLPDADPVHGAGSHAGAQSRSPGRTILRPGGGCQGRRCGAARQAVLWGERTPNCIPAKLRAIHIVPGAAPATTAADPLAALGPAVLHLEAHGVLTKGSDFALTYLIGNVACAPLWVQQNTRTPAAVVWSLKATDQVPLTKEVVLGRHQAAALAIGDSAASRNQSRIWPEDCG